MIKCSFPYSDQEQIDQRVRHLVRYQTLDAKLWYLSVLDTPCYKHIFVDTKEV